MRLGTQLQSLPVSSLPEPQQAVINSDPVLRGLVHDHAIRGEDFGAFYDRLHALDAASPRAPGDLSLGKADAMYDQAAKAPGAPPASNLFASPRARMGIFAAPPSPLDKAIGDATKLEKQGKTAEAAAKWKEAADLLAGGAGPGSAADRKSTAASYYAHAGELYRESADALAEKGDPAGAKQAYLKAGDAYAESVKRTNVKPNLATGEHWDANQVADRGLAGIEAYEKAGLSIQKNGTAQTIGNLDVAKVKAGIEDSYGFDMGFDRGRRWMRLGDALARSGDKPGALEAYQQAKRNFDDAIAEDKKFYPEGLQKHVVPMERAELRMAVMKAELERAAGKVFPPSDFRNHLLAAEALPPGMKKADEYYRALQSRNEAMPKDLRAAVMREASDTVAEEMKSVEKSGTNTEKAAYAEKAADYFDAFGNPTAVKDAQAMAARANLKLAESATDPQARAELYAKAARQMDLSGRFSAAEIEAIHFKAAAAYTQAAQLEKNSYVKGGLLGKAGDEYRAAKKETEAQASFRAGAAAYLAASKEPPTIFTSKTPGTVTVADLGGSPSMGELKANTLGKAAALYEKAGTQADRASAAALRTRSEALHNLALREKFKDPVFQPPVALDGGEITPKSIADYENAVLAKLGGDHEKAAAYFESMRDAQANAGPGGTVGPHARYFDGAASRMHALQTLKDAGVKNISNPPSRDNLRAYATARAAFWRGQKDADGLPLRERDVAAKVAGELGEVAQAFYAHRDEVGRDIDYAPGGKNVVTVDTSGRMQCDCEVYAYDVALAMEAAGFKCSTETRDPRASGESHVIVNLRDKDGAYCGSMSNGEYFDSADAAFSSVALPPGSTKEPVIKKREDDPRAPK